MNYFKDMGIKAPDTAFTGDKIKLSKILNEEIIVLQYKIEKSKFEEKGNGNRLVLQIEWKGNLHILFSGSITLMDMISKVPKHKMPFTTHIRLINERPQFT